MMQPVGRATKRLLWVCVDLDHVDPTHELYPVTEARIFAAERTHRRVSALLRTLGRFYDELHILLPPSSLHFAP